MFSWSHLCLFPLNFESLPLSFARVTLTSLTIHERRTMCTLLALTLSRCRGSHLPPKILWKNGQFPHTPFILIWGPLITYLFSSSSWIWSQQRNLSRYETCHASFMHCKALLQPSFQLNSLPHLYGYLPIKRVDKFVDENISALISTYKTLSTKIKSVLFRAVKRVC